MKEITHVTNALRIKILEKPLIIHLPGDRQNYTVLQPSEEWEEATNHPRLFGWIILPDRENRGLSLEQWRRFWDDMKVEVEAQNADGSWSDLFE